MGILYGPKKKSEKILLWISRNQLYCAVHFHSFQLLSAEVFHFILCFWNTFLLFHYFQMKLHHNKIKKKNKLRWFVFYFVVVSDSKEWILLELFLAYDQLNDKQLFNAICNMMALFFSFALSLSSLFTYSHSVTVQLLVTLRLWFSALNFIYFPFYFSHSYLLFFSVQFDLFYKNIASNKFFWSDMDYSIFILHENEKNCFALNFDKRFVDVCDLSVDFRKKSLKAISATQHCFTFIWTHAQHNAYIQAFSVWYSMDRVIGTQAVCCSIFYYQFSLVTNIFFQKSNHYSNHNT